MSFDYSKCRQLVQDAILAGLRYGAEEIAKIPIPPNPLITDRDVSAVALDFVPGDYQFGIYFRTWDEGKDSAIRYSLGDWEHQILVPFGDSQEIDMALNWLVKECQEEGAEVLPYQAKAHLTYLAAAEALLELPVTEELARRDIGVCFANGDPSETGVEHIVFSECGPVGLQFNYCEHVLANRFTKSITSGELLRKQLELEVRMRDLREEYESYVNTYHPEVDMEDADFELKTLISFFVWRNEQ